MSKITGERSNFFPQGKVVTKDKVQKTPYQGSLESLDRDVTTPKDARVDIQDATKDFSRIKRAVDLSPDMDNGSKVNRLRERIDRGEYKIDYDALADKILNEEFGN